MTMRARKPAEPKGTEAKSAKKRWKVHVNEPVGELTSANDATPHIGVADLELAALDPTPLPWRTELERHFERPLPYLTAYQGPAVDAALAHDDAAAAVKGDAVLLPQDADKPLVAHEVAHILQQDTSAKLADPAQAEIEAYRAEQNVAADQHVPDTKAALPTGAVALRSNDALDEQDLLQGSDREAAANFSDALGEDQQPDATATPEPEQQGSDESVLGDVSPGAPLAEDPVPTFEPPAMPDVEVDEDAAEATQAEAEAALSGADEADGLVSAFKDAPPSVKALHHDQLDGEIGEMAEKDQTDFEARMPEFPAEMSGTDDLAEPAEVLTPEAREAQLEDGNLAPPPEPQVDPTPDPGTPDLNAAVADFLANFFSFGDAGSLGQTFNRVSTSDNDVETSAGARPDVPLEGQTDPQRVDDQDTAARDDAKTNRMEATQAVTDGPGPEQVELQELREDFTMEAREKPAIDQAEGAVEGAAGFRDKGLDGEVTALFDAHHNEAMASSMEEAETEVSGAVDTRDTERDTALADAETERTRLNEEADASQRDEVTSRRQDVQDARQHAVDEQQARVNEMETQADLDRQAAEDTIETEVSDAETQVEADFSQAEDDAQSEVDAGERDAEAERERQERESENQSWWDRAAGWVADQFDKLTKFINDVFDAVRSAVKGIIDAVKEAAIALIDAAVSAITSAIEALGEALKAAVNALLAEHFPELAAALNEAIDSTVTAATEFVEAVGEGLKTAVSALLDALAAGIDAILAAYQAAINTALAIARAALTGDWGELAKLILEPILYALGIEPAAFYQMIARAMEALDIIIDDPIGFLSNLIDTVVGGIRQFGGNIVTHLQAGIIGWLTGALGGDIQIPQRFDLMGVLDLARQILGLTVDMIRRVAVRVLGEEAVERIEFVMGYVVELVTGGFSALWDKIMADLSTLKDLVLDGIKSFLMERIVMAAITWLASMFSPVGALVKLVMTIWNFMMFLKDQLARIIQVVQTVVNTMWEIATGVLQPAMDGVEGVLGRLLPIVIDLLARLLGLGNVAGRVREIIGDVRQRIEDALVNLINRVLSAFTGGRMGGGNTPDNNTPAGDGEIMAPIAVRGGGESHTLRIEDQGETVVPMIHSTPQTLESWLDSRAAAPFEALAEESGWNTPDQADEKGRKKTELQTLVARAKEEEAQLDRAAEAAEDAITANPETATDETQATQAEGEQTKRALEEVLDFFGINPNQNLADHFAQDLARLNPQLSQQLGANVLNRLDAPRYMTLPWTQARTNIAAESVLPGAWLRPTATDGIVRRIFNDDYRTGVMQIVEGHIGPAFEGNPANPTLDHFLNNYLTAELNQPANVQRILETILESNSGGGVAAAVSSTIRDAADRAYGNPLGYDAAFGAVTGSFYRDQLVPNAASVIENPQFGLYYDDEARNSEVGRGSTDMSGGHGRPFAFFVRDEGQGGTKRHSGNRTRLANAVRGASPGNHEWIPASRASAILAATATQIEQTGALDPASGLAKLLRFQHEVRTPTSKLVFKPHAGLAHADRTIPFISRAHANSGIAFADLTDVQRDDFYPTGGPGHLEETPVMQAHAGGLDAGTLSGGQLSRGAELQWSSPDWHIQLEQRLNRPIDDNIASDADGPAIRNAILGYYRETIWQGAQRLPAPKRVHFDLYYTSTDSQWRTYGQLKDHARRTYTQTVSDLETDMNRVFS